MDSAVKKEVETIGSNAQKRATAKYKARVREEGLEKTICITFSKSDLDLYEYARSNRPTATYIKNLIRADKGRNQR